YPDFWDETSEQARQKGRKFLSDMGLTEAQIDGVVAWERTFKFIGNVLTAKMKELKINPETIKEFSNRLKHFIPHRWYGNWLVRVYEETTDPETGRKKQKTIHLYDTDSTLTRAAKSVRIQKQLAELDAAKYRRQYGQSNPEYKIELIRANDYPSESLQEAPSYVVRAISNEVLNRMDLSKLGADTEAELKAGFNQMMKQIYKEKAGGKLFLKRKNIPGYSEDLIKPAADYINHFTGFITKLEMMEDLSKALQQIPRKHMPKLFDYGVEYAKYNMRPVNEMLGFKKWAYMMYLWGNISSAHLQLTQDFITAWPELSKYTDRSLEKMITALGDVIYNEIGGGRISKQEQLEIERFREAGFLEPRETLELAGRIGGIFDNPRPATGIKIQRGVKYVDIFRKMEMVNREAMALALIRSGIKVDTELDATIEGKILGGQLIDNAHFMYGKANRPKLMRGLTSPLTVFRSFGIHFLGWAKIQVDSAIKGDGKAAGALLRSMFANWYFGGFASLLGVRFIASLWKEIFGTDLENELIESYGEVGRILWEGPMAQVFPVAFSRRVSPFEIPTPDDFRTWRRTVQSIGGVLTDLPIRMGKMWLDMENQDYLRLLEDASPSAISNIVQGYRLHTRGLEKRTGKPIAGIGTQHRVFQSPLKLTTPEMIFKMMGYQPKALEQQWKITDNVRQDQSRRLGRLQNWAARWTFAARN
ncbi:MAG: PLxRFG domain-containing protein, partial [Candidatus Lokiarchaeota archaeon]|nr:PLxRFG domain-containing protein [Candidatus Lokiarchaeota archaeon]